MCEANENVDFIDLLKDFWRLGLGKPSIVIYLAPMALRFQFDETKAVEALTYIAMQWPGVTAFYTSKILFFAEKMHLNRYGRPIVADTFIAMSNGPVPSTIYDFIEGKLDQAGDPEAITKAVEVERGQYAHVRALRPADADALSASDIECLDEAIALCRRQGFKALSSRTHQERAYLEAPANGPMDYEAFIDDDNPHRAELLDEAREFAVYGVL
jgi:uncharacterized phage-associated protein